jgi:hypothetical protein
MTKYPMLIKKLESIDIIPILTEYTRLEPNIVWTDYGFKGKQSGLQHKENEDVWASAVGRSSGNEFASSILNPFFKDTVFEEIINKYKLFKTRLMWLNPYACYSMHQDESPRIHIPLVTNKHCYFIFKKFFPTYLEINNVYWTDTTHYHSFMNCSDLPRLHLVGAVQS